MKRAYVGVTDVTSFGQIERYRVYMDQIGDERLFAAGVMMSYKTLWGIKTSFAEVFPKKEMLSQIFKPCKNVINVLHFADYNGESGVEDWITGLQWCGPHVHALQLDMTWPDPQEIREFKRRCSNCTLIIQIGHAALAQITNELNEKIIPYAGSVDYLLFDQSGGKGVKLDVTQTIRCLDQITVATLGTVNLVVAGGLCAETMEVMVDISERFRNVSIDAQGKLRSSGDFRDPVEDERVFAYLHAAHEQVRR